MVNISMHFEGYTEEILREALARGLVKTKAEALRLGLLELNNKYGLIPPFNEMEYLEDLESIRKIERDIKTGKEKVRRVGSIDDLFK